MMSHTTKPYSSAAYSRDGSPAFRQLVRSDRDRAGGEFILKGSIRGLDMVLARPRYGRSQMAGDEESADVTGHRHGSRTRSLTGTFGPIEIAVPRARLNITDGKTTEWKSQALRAYQRRTLPADALIAGAYLAGTNTRRVRRALAALFGGAVGKDTVSWVLAQGADRLGSLECPLAGRGADRAAYSRRHGGACAARPQGDLDLVARCPRRARGRPKGAARNQKHGRKQHRGLARCPRRSHQARSAAARVPHRRRRAGLDKAIATVWDCVPVQRCTVHKHRNLLAHAPERLHEEIGADYSDMIYAATREDIETCRKAFIRKWRLKHRAVANSLVEAGDRLFTFTGPAAEPVAQCTHNKCHRAAARRVQAKDQNPDRAAVGRHRRHAVLGVARVRSDQHAQG